MYDSDGERIALPERTGYCLPTEAEWEFSCRAGTATNFSSGEKVSELSNAGWFRINSQSRPHVVGELSPNGFGLYDMHGNVNEWVEDAWDPVHYDTWRNSTAIDPRCVHSLNGMYILRGGAFGHSASHCRSSAKHAADISECYNDTGFRVAFKPRLSSVTKP